MLAEELIDHLNPIRLKIEDLLKNRDFLELVLRNGREWAIQSADKTMNDVRNQIGVKIV